MGSGGSPTLVALGFQRRPERRGHALDLCLAHRAEERQRDQARGGVLGHRELALAVAEALAIVGQEVDARHVGLRLDSVPGELAEHGVAISVGGQQNRVDEPASALGSAVGAGQDEAIGVAFAGRAAPDRAEPLAVQGRHPGPRREQLVDPLELRHPDRGLEVGEPVVEAEPLVRRASPCPAPRPWLRSLRIRAAIPAEGGTITPPSAVVSCLLA